MSIGSRQTFPTNTELHVPQNVFEDAKIIMEANPMHTILAIESTRQQGQIDITLQKPDLLRVLGAVDYLAFFRLRNLNQHGKVENNTQRLTKVTKTEFHEVIDPKQPIQYKASRLDLTKTKLGKLKAISTATLWQGDEYLATTTGTFIGIAGGQTLEEKLADALRKKPRAIVQQYASRQDKDMRDVVCPDDELTNSHDGPAAIAYLDPNDIVRRNSKGIQHGGWLSGFAAIHLESPQPGTEIEVELCRLKEGDRIFLFKENPHQVNEMSSHYTEAYTIRDLRGEKYPILTLKANYPLDLRRNLAK